MAQTHWTTRATPLFKPYTRVSHIFKLNETELLIVLMCSIDNKLVSLWLYNFLNEKKTEVFKASCFLGLDDICHYTSALDNNKSLLYLFGENGKIMKINLKTKQIEISSQCYHDGSHSRSLFIGTQFHIFGGWEENDKSHFIWNENKQNLIEICKFEQITEALSRHSIQYLKSKKSVLIILHDSQKIYLYSLSQNKLTQFPMNLSDNNIYDPESVLSRNEQYVIIFNWLESDILILDLKTKTIRTSNIIFDEGDYNRFIIMSSIQREELLCFGYIRKCWKSLEFSEIIFLPYYLIKIIDKYLCFEIIHTMNGWKHLSINIDNILAK